jgi:hypothetical protein
VGAGQAGEGGRQQHPGRRGERADPQRPRRPAPRGGECRRGAFELLQHGLRVLDEELPRGRQRDRAPRAFEQWHARLPFQRAELLGDGRRRERDRLGDRGDRAAPGELAQEVELAWIEHKLSLSSTVEIRAGANGLPSAKLEAC